MSSVPPVGKKTGIPDFPFPSPLRAQIKAGELCLGTNTPATADLRVVATICQRDIDWLWIDCEHGWASSVEGVGGKSIHVLPTRVLHPTPPHPTISLRLTGPACCPCTAACVLARSRGVAPIIRVAWNDPALIKKALDMGAVRRPPSF